MQDPVRREGMRLVLRDDLEDIRKALDQRDGAVDRAGVWSEPLWENLLALDAPRWGLAARWGGLEVDRAEILGRYLAVSAGSLTAALVLTQHDAAVRRLERAANLNTNTSTNVIGVSGAIAAVSSQADAWLHGVGAGTIFPTVGISQLTTSRRMGSRALVAIPHDSGKPGSWRLQGAMPWVTGAHRANLFVTGAVVDAGQGDPSGVQQVLVAVPSDRAGVRVEEPFDLIALAASDTAPVFCDGAEIRPAECLAGPAPEVLGPTTGSLETSAAALGQALAMLEVLTELRPNSPLVGRLLTEWSANVAEMFQLARSPQNAQPVAVAASSPDAQSHALTGAGALRRRANLLALHVSQALLVARKGSGLLRSDPAQRWCRQALFFLVWSCPEAVSEATLEHLADSVCDLTRFPSFPDLLHESPSSSSASPRL